MSQSPRPAQPDLHAQRSATVIETDEHMRQALLTGHRPEQRSTTVLEQVAPAPPIVQRPTSSFRPTIRPPIAVLMVFDDGKPDGEVIRIRDSRFVIGRTEGDLRIPIDGRISSRHVEISLQTVGGMHRWVVTDLQSTHGMFVRVSRTVLADKAEFLVGNGRYQFDANQPAPGATVEHVPMEAISGETQGWGGGPSPIRPPAVTELIGNEIGNRVLLVKPEYWIGSDPSCPICRPDDPFCEPRHVRLFRAQNGSWHAEHSKTQNGLWLRMSQISIDPMVHFQIGEQRFRIKVS